MGSGFGQSRINDAVWFLSVFDEDVVEGERLSTRIQRTVAAIVMAGLAASESRAVARIAIPVRGIGYGGQGGQRGRALDTLLHALWRCVQQHGVDIVLVTPDLSVFSAAQHRRRTMAGAGDKPLPWSLSADAVAEAARLGGLARDGHLALFPGAGVSIAAGLPSWDRLLTLIAERTGVDLEPIRELGSPLDAAELLKQAVEPQVLGEVVAETLDETTRISLAHGLLAGLGAREAISTNYDRLFERAVTRTGRTAPAVLPWEPVEVGRPWLLKLRGDLRRPESIVLTRRDFVLFDARSRPAGSLLQATLMTKHLLIVGASLADDNVIRLAMEVDEYLRTNGTEVVQGTFIDVSGHAARQQLWTRQFDWFVCPGEDTKARVRQMEIFLDVVAAYAATDASWLLDDRFSGLLNRDERPIVERVKDALGEVPADGSGLLGPLVSVRESLGG